MITPDINTKMITLIGTPLSQSFAARMQNSAFAKMNANMIYFYTEQNSDHLEEIINGIRYMNFAGCAVTKPNKVNVLQYLDELDPLCEKMGASNTVVKTADGRLVGYNTDGIGFIRSIEKEGVAIKGATFFCIGCGGAGRAMCSALAYFGASRIILTDAVEESAKSLVEDINKNFAPVAEFAEFGDFSKVSEVQNVLNASGIGMGSHIGENPLPKEYISADQFYFDACYNPDKTQFLLDAEAAGAKVLNGLGMSLYQGAEQIKLWSGEDAPIDTMAETLQEILAEKAK